MPNSIKNIQIKASLAIATLLFFAACGKETKRDFEVDAKLENISSPVVYAVKEISPDSLTIDTITVNNKGEFKYGNELNRPGVVTIYSGIGTCPLSFYLDKDYKIKITGDATHPDLVEIKGGQVNNDILSFKTANKALLDSRLRIISKKENMDPAELKNINIQLAQKVREFVINNPANIASVMLMNEYSLENVAPELLSADVALLKGKALEYYEKSPLKTYFDAHNLSAEGAKAPAITLKNTKNKKVNLKDYKGKHVALIFDIEESASNKAYIDNIKEVYKKLNPKKVSLLTVLIDADSLDAEAIKLSNTLDWNVLKSSKKWGSDEVRMYNITTVPYIVLIDSAGVINQRGIELDDLLEKFKK